MIRLLTTKACGLYAESGSFSDPKIWKDSHGNKVNRVPGPNDTAYVTSSVSGTGPAREIIVVDSSAPRLSLVRNNGMLARKLRCCCKCHCPRSCDDNCNAPVPALEVNGGLCSKNVSCNYSSYLGYYYWDFTPDNWYDCLPCAAGTTSHGSGFSVSMRCETNSTTNQPIWKVTVVTGCTDYGFFTYNGAGDPNDPNNYTYTPGDGNCTITYEGEIEVENCKIKTGAVSLTEVNRESYPDFGSNTDPCSTYNLSAPDITVL